VDWSKTATKQSKTATKQRNDNKTDRDHPPINQNTHQSTTDVHISDDASLFHLELLKIFLSPRNMDLPNTNIA
jgi:hypothetical protein